MYIEIENNNYFYNKTKLTDLYIYKIIDNNKNICNNNVKIITEFTPNYIIKSYTDDKNNIIIFINGEVEDVKSLINRYNYVDIFITYQESFKFWNSYKNKYSYNIQGYLSQYWNYNEYFNLNNLFINNIKNKLYNIKNYDFCSFISSHKEDKNIWLNRNKIYYNKSYYKNLSNIRFELFRYLNENYKHILSGGRIENNINHYIKNKDDLLKQTIFNLCFENCIYDNYLTEKIFDSYKNGCIPIYCGDPNVKNIFNNNTFINCLDDNNQIKSFEKIKYEIENFNFNYIKENIYNNDFSIFNDKNWFNIKQEKLKIELNSALNQLT